MHMLMHCLFRHMFSAKQHEDAQLWDLCCDIAVEDVYKRQVSMHVNSVPLRRDAIVPILIHRNVKSVDAAQLHVLTMQSHI